MSWSDDVRRANETLDWIEQRQGPLPEAGYARIQTTVGQVRAMAEGQDDARIAEIRARYAGLEKLLEDTTGQWDRSQLLPMVSELAGAAKTIPYLLERLDALTAERDLLRVERDIARRVEQESSAAADAWQAEAVKVRAERDALTAERDARIKTLENDLEHALASVGAFRQAIEKVFAKADEHEIDQGGMIVTYVLPCGPLHRAIGLARGTDAGGKLLAERDALAARLAAAEAASAAKDERLAVQAASIVQLDEKIVRLKATIHDQDVAAWKAILGGESPDRLVDRVEALVSGVVAASRAALAAASEGAGEGA